MQRWKDSIRQHSGLLILLVSGLLVPLITNLVSSWLEATFGQTPSRLLQLLALGVAAAVALWVVALALRPGPEPLVLVPRDARPRRSPGLVVLVGKGRPGHKLEFDKQAAAKAMDYHLGSDDGGDPALKVCWLVASSGEMGSVSIASEIRAAYESRCKVVIREVGNAFSVQDTYDVVQRIYNEEISRDEFQEFELSPGSVLCDFTSGTAPMTAGMVLACGRYRPMQYTTGRPPKGGEPEIVSVPQLVEFRPTRRKRGG
jgi:hypothetical protein